MKRLTENLMPGEEVMFTTRLHFYHAATAVAVAALAFVLFLIVAAMALSYTKGGTLLGILAAGLFLIALGFLAKAWLTISSSLFAVTNKRLIIHQGILRRTSSEMLLSKVESIVVEVDLAGRILGFGTITVKGTGGSAEVFPGVRAPESLRTAALQQIDAADAALPGTHPR